MFEGILDVFLKQIGTFFLGYSYRFIMAPLFNFTKITT